MPSSLVFLFVYGAVFLALFFGGALWRRRGRKDRAPFPENARLLRGSGESLRRKLIALDERSTFEFLIAFAIPPLVSAALVWVAVHLSGYAQLTAFVAALLGLIASLIFVTRRLIAGIDTWRNVNLGYFGERIVGEALDPLKADGFRVFHDVPAGDDKSPFNIDHVIIGPSGVFAIETKTRRKGRARAGFAEHEIIYDGQVLAYPWGEDRHGLDQALRQARWLQTWLGQLLGDNIPVQPILTFPGWMVITRARGAVTVLNPKQIPAAVALHGAPVMTADQIDLVARQLEARCRDVEF
ncbi:MAG: nuclease-related domain-containing protein [Opitutaceae bacterium]|jgi:hypothetical protein